MAILKLLRNNTLYATREEAISGISTVAANREDGEMWVATWGTQDESKSILAVKRTWGVTMFDLDAISGEISGLEEKLAEVAFSGSASDVSAVPIEGDDQKIAVTGNTIPEQIASLATTIKTNENNAKSYKVVAVDSPAVTSLAEYKLQVAEGASETYSDVTGSSTIVVPKDNAFVTAQLGHVGATADASTGTITDGSGEDALLIEYVNGSGVYTLVAVPIGAFLKEAEFKDGLAVSANGEVSAKLGNGLGFGNETEGNKSIIVSVDHNSEGDSQTNPVAFLTITNEGIKIQGIKDEIDRKINALDATVGGTTVEEGKHIAVQIVEENGILTSLTITEDGIANAEDVTEIERVTSAALNDLETRKADKSDLDELSGDVLENVTAGNGINVGTKANKTQEISVKLDTVKTDNVLSLTADGLYVSQTVDCGTY